MGGRLTATCPGSSEPCLPGLAAPQPQASNDAMATFHAIANRTAAAFRGLGRVALIVLVWALVAGMATMGGFASIMFAPLRALQ